MIDAFDVLDESPRKKCLQYEKCRRNVRALAICGEIKTSGFDPVNALLRHIADPRPTYRKRDAGLCTLLAGRKFRGHRPID